MLPVLFLKSYLLHLNSFFNSYLLNPNSCSLNSHLLILTSYSNVFPLHPLFYVLEYSPHMSTETEIQTSEIERLFSVGAHFGVAKSRRHPSQIKNIFGQKDRIDLFDLEKTYTALQVACEYAKKLGSEKKDILFVGGKPESTLFVKRHAERIDAP